MKTKYSNSRTLSEISSVRSNKCGFGGQIVPDLPVILRRIEQDCIVCTACLDELVISARRVARKACCIETIRIWGHPTRCAGISEPQINRIPLMTQIRTVDVHRGICADIGEAAP